MTVAVAQRITPTCQQMPIVYGCSTNLRREGRLVQQCNVGRDEHRVREINYYDKRDPMVIVEGRTVRCYVIDSDRRITDKATQRRSGRGIWLGHIFGRGDQNDRVTIDFAPVKVEGSYFGERVRPKLPNSFRQTVTSLCQIDSTRYAVDHRRRSNTCQGRNPGDEARVNRRVYRTNRIAAYGLVIIRFVVIRKRDATCRPSFEGPARATGLVTGGVLRWQRHRPALRHMRASDHGRST
jgi:hypothetical protein